MSWCTIESDPGVFSELIEMYGTRGVEVREVLTLEDEGILTDVIYGFIFLFKWSPEKDSRSVISPQDVPEVYFAKQTTQNACATQAILSILLNRPEIDLGEDLTQLKNFTLPIDPVSRGMAIGGAEKIRLAHNSFASPDHDMREKSSSRFGKKEDAFHFVAYVPICGKVYELDGLREGPICLGEVPTDSSWSAVAIPAIAERMQTYSEKETKFSLLRVSRKKLDEIRQEMANLEEMEMTDEVALRLVELSEKEKEEEDLERQYKAENARRRHNYIPFTLALLKGLAKNNMLSDCIEKANTKNRRK